MPGGPTQVPLELMARIIRVASDPGDLILDPFNGTGSTGHAALLAGRRYLGIEKVKENADWSKARLAAAAHEVQKVRKAS
jgi:modification methylase